MTGAVLYTACVMNITLRSLANARVQKRVILNTLVWNIGLTLWAY
jgi:hypothetical protein